MPRLRPIKWAITMRHTSTENTKVFLVFPPCAMCSNCGKRLWKRLARRSGVLTYKAKTNFRPRGIVYGGGFYSFQLSVDSKSGKSKVRDDSLGLLDNRHNPRHVVVVMLNGFRH